MASLSADDRNKRMQAIIRRIKQKLARRQEEDFNLRCEIKLLEELAIPQGDSETVEAADVEWGECPDCKASGGKPLQISRVYLPC